MNDQERQALYDWLRRHDVDPDLVPEDARIRSIRYHDGQTVWHVDTFVRDQNGDLVVSANGFSPLRATTTFVEREPHPWAA